MIKTILVPTDLSALAGRALRVAVDLARAYNAEIRLVRYLPFLTVLNSGSEDHTGLRHFLRGSVADDVLNHATVPVLIQKLNTPPTL